MTPHTAPVGEAWREVACRIAAEPAPASSLGLTGQLAADYPFDFDLPEALSAREPAEARGLARDEVRLMVSNTASDEITHGQFHEFPDFLSPGDVLVVNASATINAALDAWREDADGGFSEQIVLHISSPLPADMAEAMSGERNTAQRNPSGGELSSERWVIELRRVTAIGSNPLLDARPGERIHLRGGATATIERPWLPEAVVAGSKTAVRLWVASLSFPPGVLSYTAEHGSPIRYGYVPARWPLEFYQTVFSEEPGSAEMPSAGRAFTPEVVARLKEKKVRIAPLVLHSGVSSLEADETPYPERFSVPEVTADAVNDARSR
ncbi:MAG: S-adenosylmethionine:tRNA ribosyltransferase-isomerase, partial [Anaerolineae bacterium]|nr:S-adenosylmethionine:tRNA ribosyltransferase-isomerase [Gemmatimonadaceae bacterium]